MTYQQIVNRNTDYAILLCFMSGIVQLIMAVLNLGVLVDFISIPVTVGFTSATSVIIGASQIKSLLGLKISSSGFVDTITKVSQNIHKTKFSDATLGFGCIAILMLLRVNSSLLKRHCLIIKLFQKLKDVQLQNKNKKLLKYIMWLISTSRNALVVITCSTVAYFYETKWAGSPFLLTGAVKAGVPELKLPPFETVVNNRTVGFSEMVGDLGSSVILVPVIAVLGNVAIAKAFGNPKTKCTIQNCLIAFQLLER